MADNALQNIVKEFRELLDPIAKAAGDPAIRREILTALNLNPNQASQPINIPSSALSSIDAYTAAAAEDVDLEAFASVVEDVLQISLALKNFIDAARGGGGGGTTLNEAVTAYLNMTTLGYVRVRWPGIYIGVKVLRLLEEQAIRYGGLFEFFLKTGSFFEELYGDSWDLETEEHAKNLSDGILFLVGVVATIGMKAEILYGWDAEPSSPSPIADSISDRTLSLAFNGKTDDGLGNIVAGKLITSFVLIPEEHQGPALLIRLKGSTSLEIPVVTNSFLKVSVSAPDAIIHIGEGGSDFPASTDASIGLSLIHKPSEDGEEGDGEERREGVLYGSPNGTHLLLGKTTLDGKISANDHSIKLGTEESSLTIAGGDADSFINQILPSGNVKIDFRFGIGYSKKRGFFLEGGAGFLVAIPLHEELGPLNLQTLTLGFKLGNGSALNLESSLSFSLKLGALTAAVDRIGLASNLSFPEGGGNLGSANLEVKFKPPTGVGLSIDGGGFKGGGFLSFDPDNQRYEGMLELEFKDTIALKAIGLLTTDLPDGSDGYSLLIIITSEFTPVQLGFGFTLNGVGGLLGLNRTVNVERLRSGVKEDTLSSVLFPTDIVANASRIISDLRQVFPPAEGRFIFGPMAKIGWGSPTLITVDLGLIIELPEPVNISILGVLKTLLPDEDSEILRLQVNFLGVIDFEQKRLSFDASLFDSKLLSFTLSGDMALRIAWGNEPNFLLSVGGFHPAYEPPPLAIPNMSRLSISLLGGSNPRITIETYFAVTSNTVQFGARAELYAASGRFNIYGFVGFDVLFQFNPFYFDASIGAMLALRVGSSSIASISVSGNLEGPTPWKVKGKAKLKLFWFLTVKVPFSKQWGSKRNTELDDIAVLPLLMAALEETNNWTAEIPSQSHLLVTLRSMDTSSGAVIAHPFGTLSISQKVVPLNLVIDKFGNREPSDANEFSINGVTVGEGAGAVSLNTRDVPEQFAPAQFLDMKDADKLSSKSFEKYDGGVAVIESETLASGDYAMRAVEYELSYIDSQRNLIRWPFLFAPDALAFNTWSTTGAIALSPLSFAKNKKPALAPDAVQLTQEAYAIVNKSDLKVVDDKSMSASEGAAISRLRQIVKENPALARDLEIVPAFEVQS